MPKIVATQDSSTRRAKITIIGGGSLYCIGLLKSMARQAAAFRHCHITLMDINKESLNLVYMLGSKLFQHVGAELTLSRTTNQKAALAEADIVFTTFRMGGLQATVLDETLPLQHGFIGHETAGVGGFFAALRTIPIVAGIAAELEKVAPRAFLLNYTNPDNIVTQAVAQSSGIRSFGISNASQQAIQHLVRLAGITLAPGQRLYQRTFGLNHSNWTTTVWHDGNDLMPYLLKWAEQEAQHEMTLANYEQVMLALLLTQYKAIPSRDMCYYYFPERVLSFSQQKATTPAEDMLAAQPSLLAHCHEEAKKEEPRLPNIYGSDEFGDFALDILHALLNDTGIEGIVSAPHNGAVSFLAHERVIELPCHIDKRGAIPLMQDDNSIDIDQRGLLYQLAEYQAATARAALWGTRRDAIKALTANPLVASYSKAEAVYDTLASAHARYLPQRLLT